MTELSLTVILIAITVGISLFAFRNYDFLGKLIMNPYQITRNKEYWRFLTSGFIHADYGHLFFNMFTLYSFGQFMEYVFQQTSGEMGQIYFLILYLGGIIVSDMPTYFKNKNNYHYNSLGASGGVSSVLFAAILFGPTQTLQIYAILPVPAVLFAVLYTWYSIYMSRRNMDNVNHSAHLYGALYGVIFTTLVYPKVWSIFISQILLWIQSF
ncbi:rhomboid family intramembrane serine protease [Flectobacillus major]|jgi:membrane associated rhomboid family serine protease|uniref:rhomboid family intramembrane serine protease n=1 Tax=Flectobacillus major TaxID=103 RepID=UPI00040FE235|nr:rhomboid family intramembrane serine protease [Flectobacillus major]